MAAEQQRQQPGSASGGMYGTLSGAVLAQGGVPTLEASSSSQPPAGTSASAAYTKRFVEGLLDPELGDAAGIAQAKLKHKVILLDNPGKQAKTAAGAAAADDGGPPAKRKKKAPRMSSRRAKSLGLFRVPEENQKYALYEPLHDMWLQYVAEATQCDDERTTLSNLQQRLLKADFHGAKISVQKSKCPSYVGLAGIVIQETENVFRIITETDNIKAVPKQNNVFAVPLGRWKATLYGNHFRFRPSQRVARKFKAKASIDL